MWNAVDPGALEDDVSVRVGAMTVVSAEDFGDDEADKHGRPAARAPTYSLAPTVRWCLAGTDGYILAGPDGYILASTDGYILAGTDGYILAGTDGYILAGTDGYILASTDGYILAGPDGYMVPEVLMSGHCLHAGQCKVCYSVTADWFPFGVC